MLHMVFSTDLVRLAHAGEHVTPARLDGVLPAMQHQVSA